MKKQFIRHLPAFKKEKKECHHNLNESISHVFARIKHSYSILDSIKLQSLLECQKYVKPIDDCTKKQIFAFFLRKELEEFHFLKSRSRTHLSIMKIVKIKLQDHPLDWLEIWRRILNEVPEVSRKQISRLQQFLGLVKILFDENNLMQVFKYFSTHHNDGSEFLFKYIFLFSNVTVNTSEEIFCQLMDELQECYFKGKIKSKTFVIYFINLLKKRKTHSISSEQYEVFNSILLNNLISPQFKDEKNSIEAQFTKEHALVISQFIGEKNPCSESLLKMVFDIAEKFISPFENSSRPVRFLYVLIRGIWKRKEREQKAEEALKKLQDKQLKSKQSIAANQDAETDAKTQAPTSELAFEDKNKEQADDEEIEIELESEEELDVDEGDEGEVYENEEELLSTAVEEKKNKCLRILNNRITPEQMGLVEAGVQRVFNYIYFVNSKKTVPQFVRYSFIIRPELIIKSLDLLDKASEIPYINEEGLVQNIKITVQYMFSEALLKDSLNNLQRVLDRIINCTKILDVWPIYELIFAKIPLLDERDLETVPEEDKAYFEQKFDLNHDRFYENYSDNVFRAFKRLVSEGEFFDEEISRQNSSTSLEILLNSYPFFQKRMLSEIMEQIVENRNNQFVYNYFTPAFQLSASNESIVQEQLSLINAKETEENVELRNNLVMLLCYNRPLQSLKGYIREFASKNYYRVIPMYFTIRADLQLTTDPVQSSLKHYEKDPKMPIKVVRPTQSRLEALEEFHQYNQELIGQLYELVVENRRAHVNQKEMKSMEHKEVISFIGSLYSVESDNGEKKQSLEQVAFRKKVAELLTLIDFLGGYLRHKVLDFEEKSMDFKSIQPLTERKSLLENGKFFEIVKFFIHDKAQGYLEDNKITARLSEIISHEMVFSYANLSKSSKEKIKRYNVSNSYQELSGFQNRLLLLKKFRETMKLIHYLNLMNEIKSERRVESEDPNYQLHKGLANEMKILTSAPGNEKSSTLIKMVLIRTGLSGVSDHIKAIFGETHILSRFYWEKAHQIYESYKGFGLELTPEEVLKMVESHQKILNLGEQKKLKQIGVKSMKTTLNLIREQADEASAQNAPEIFIEGIEKSLRVYKDTQKLQMVWLISISFLLNSRKFTYIQSNSQKQRVQKLQRISEILRDLQSLVVSDMRIIRRLALFMYSLCFRKMKKIMRKEETRTVSNVEYEKIKSLEDFIEAGYLREMHRAEGSRVKTLDDGLVEKVKRADNLHKLGPYQSYEVSVIDTKSEAFEEFDKIQGRCFEFILEKEEVFLQFLNNFLADMVSTAQQLVSMSTSMQKNTSLSDLIVKELDDSFYFFVPKKLIFERVELFLGERFFKYFLLKDAQNGCTFVLNEKVQEIISKSLTNLDSLDNQMLLLIFSKNLLSSYQKQYHTMLKPARDGVQKIIKDVYLQLVNKASGSIFKKSAMIFKKIENAQSLEFLFEIMRQFIFKSKKQVCRNAFMYLTMRKYSLADHEKVLSVLLENRIELENAIVNNIVNSILTRPEEYPIEKSDAVKFKFIDFEKQLQNDAIYPLTKRAFFVKNSQFKDYLVRILRGYTEAQTEEDSEKAKEFLKNAYGLIINAIKCLVHLEESQEHVEKTCELVQVLIQMAENREQTQLIDYRLLQPVFKSIFVTIYRNMDNFSKLLKVCMRMIKAVPSKRQVELLVNILHRPFNFTRLNKAAYEDFIFELFELQQSNKNYKELMNNISVILSFRMVSCESFYRKLEHKYKGSCPEIGGSEGLACQELEKKLLSLKATKSQVVMFLQCEELATVSLDRQKVEAILNDATKDRRNIWCREMLSIRGKKEYLDDEEKYSIWKEVKANSNPYHYIA